MRPKGSLNKDKVLPHELAKELGINPLKILLLIAAGKWQELGLDSEKITIVTQATSREEYSIPIAVRQQAAGNACKYLYSQMRNIEGEVKVSEVKRPLRDLSDDELDAL